MSEMFPVQAVLSAEWVSIATLTDCLTMADFLPKSAIFRTRRSGSGVAVSTVQGRIVVRMAELLMNSAIAILARRCFNHDGLRPSNHLDRGQPGHPMDIIRESL